jgi:hypothetical protein
MKSAAYTLELFSNPLAQRSLRSALMRTSTKLAQPAQDD